MTKTFTTSSLKLTRTSVCLAALTFCAVSFAATTHSTVAGGVQQPTYAVGDTWSLRNSDLWSGRVYSEKKVTVIGLMGEFFRATTEERTAFPKGGGFELPKSNDATFRVSNNYNHTYQDKTTSVVNYAWPLQVGKKWQYSFTTSTGGIYTIAAEVVGQETLSLADKQLDTLKVVHQVESDINKVKSRAVWTYWYSPLAKTTVKTTYESFGVDGTPYSRTLEELIKFDVK